MNYQYLETVSTLTALAVMPRAIGRCFDRKEIKWSIFTGGSD